eukprot:4951388-Heterocapsa_arctica.AAC.1
MRGLRPDKHVTFYDAPLGHVGPVAQNLPVPEIYGDGTAASERAQHMALGVALAARLKQCADRPPTNAPADMTPPPRIMDTAAAGASYSIGVAAVLDTAAAGASYST